MRKPIISAVMIVTLLAPLLLCSAYRAAASSEYMDGKLIIQGFVKETWYYRTALWEKEKRFHDNRLDYAQTSALLEALYTVKEDRDFSVRLFAGLKCWWQKATYLSDQYRDSIPRRDRQDWIFPRSFKDDVLTEAYIDINNGPWQVRIGKQIVIWGQLDIQRVADVVNPIDIRRGSPGINPWEEVKQGLWMIRLLYQSDLPGNLLFETIFNPGDFKPFQIPLEGAHMGAKPADTRIFDEDLQKFGIFHWQREKMYRDAPGWNTSNWEFGFRVRGYTWNIDWTLLYWNARDDQPTANPYRITKFTLPYIRSGIQTAARGCYVPPPDWPGYRVFYYKRYQTVGGTAQTYLPQLWDTIWRLEWFVEIDRPLNKGTDGDNGATYAWTRRNIMGTALQVSKAINIPGFTQSDIAAGRMLDVSLTYFREQVFNHDRDLTLADRNHNWDESVTDALILFMKQDLLHNTFVFVFTGNWWMRTGKWMAVPALSYVFPGVHWRFDVSYAMYGGPSKRRWVTDSSSTDKIILRLRYEF